MKFKIRDGFVVILQEQLHGNERKPELVTGINEQHFSGGKTIDLDEAQAEAHRHKLEPLDAAAAKFLEERVAVIGPQPGSVDASGALASTIATAIQAALAGQAKPGR